MSCGSSTQLSPGAEGEAPQKAEGNNSSADIATIVKEKIPTWKDIDPTRIEIKEVSGLGGSNTFKVSIREALGATEASADIVPAAIAFQTRSELNKPLLEERNIAAGRALAKAGIGPRNIAEDVGKWSIVEWAGEAIVEKFMGPGSQSEAVGSPEKVFIQMRAKTPGNGIASRRGEF